MYCTVLVSYLLYVRGHSGALLANDIEKEENVIKKQAINQASNQSQFGIGE